MRARVPSRLRTRSPAGEQVYWDPDPRQRRRRRRWRGLVEPFAVVAALHVALAERGDPTHWIEVASGSLVLLTAPYVNRKKALAGNRSGLLGRLSEPGGVTVSPRVLELLDTGDHGAAAEQLRDETGIDLDDAQAIIGGVAVRRAAWRRRNQPELGAAASDAGEHPPES